MSRVKYSTGIALCRQCEDKIMRVLMINKRYTYAFYEFVNGHYKIASDRAIIDLFNHMTVDEKIDIMSKDFVRMWYRIWLTNRIASHGTSLARWHELVHYDNGERLARLMRASRFCADTRVWEIPKGRKRSPGEHDLDCAIREFYEETGIPRTMYHITGGTYNMSYIENDVRYEVTYFIALTMRVIDHKINSSSMVQIEELCDMRWFAAADMEPYGIRDAQGHRRIIHFAKKQIKLGSTSQMLQKLCF